MSWGASSEHKQASVYFGNVGRRLRGQGEWTPCREGSDHSLSTHTHAEPELSHLPKVAWRVGPGVPKSQPARIPDDSSCLRWGLAKEQPGGRPEWTSSGAEA